MNEETISKVLTRETDIAKMSHDDFVEMLRCLGRMYFARVMNCVDGTAKYDKEWTALSSIFNRVAEAITQKPSGNSAKLREALVQVQKKINYLVGNLTVPNSLVANRMEINGIINAALAAPPRNCDVGSAEEQAERLHRFCISQDCATCPCNVGKADGRCEFVWMQMPYEEGGAK